MMNLAAVVITYFPDEKTWSNIKTYLPYCGKLFIADNSEPNAEIPKEFSENQRVEIIRDGENKGIAKRLNQAAEAAINNGFDRLLTMDQDSFFDKENIESYLKYADEFPAQNSVAMFGVENTIRPQEVNNSFRKTVMLITSGSILNLSLFRQIGGFDENLFIDNVDHEYCFRAVRSGFENVEFDHIFLHHHLGEKKEVKSLTNSVTSLRTFHSPVRLYYMLRNFLYVSKKYKYDFPKELEMQKNDLFHRIKNYLLYEPRKMYLLKMLYKAYVDFKKNDMGKLKL